MQRRVIVTFFAGVLACAITIGAGVGAFYAVSDEAQAQGENRGGEGTWQVERFAREMDEQGNPDPSSLSPALMFTLWVEDLPAECDVQTIPTTWMLGGTADYFQENTYAVTSYWDGVGMLDTLYAYYRCPDS